MHAAYRSLVSIFALLAFALLSGCATPSIAPTGSNAPRSSVARENALTLAKLTAASIGGQVYTIAPTGSMRPTLDETSIVTIEKVSIDKLHKGDIIVYRSASGAPVIHRLYENNNGRWLVLGDNNASVDREAVTSRNFLGRVCAIFYTSTGQPPSGQAALASAE